MPRHQVKLTTVHSYDVLAARRKNPYWDERNVLKKKKVKRVVEVPSDLKAVLTAEQLRELKALLRKG